MNLSQNQIKLIRSLGQKKFRQKYHYFVAEGSKIALDVIASSYEIINIFALADWVEKYAHKLASHQDRTVIVSPKQLKQISFLKTPNNVLMVLRIPQGLEKSIDFAKGLHFYVDGIQNPGNLGTIIRIADWFGFSSVIASLNSVDFYNEKTIQASMGAFTTMNVVKSNLVDIEHVQKSHIITTALTGTSVYTIERVKDAIIVIGNEGSGISDEIFSMSNQSVSIPSDPKSSADSLNAAVSAGILASLFSRPD